MIYQNLFCAGLYSKPTCANRASISSHRASSEAYSSRNFVLITLKSIMGSEGKDMELNYNIGVKDYEGLVRYEL